jgi:endonuclease YncB( thermonuclease family)
MAMRWLPLLLVLAALLPGAGSAQNLKGEVLSIGDGDTIRVRQGGRAITVRLACIDAPRPPSAPTASKPAATSSSSCLSGAK